MECYRIYYEDLEKRIDPRYYKPEFIEHENKLQRSKYKLTSLKEISDKITSGVTPLAGGTDYTTKDEGVPFVRSGDINEDKTLNFDELIYIKKSVHDNKLRKSQLKKGDVLIAIVGATIGQVSLYDYEMDANINQAIALVRLKEEINPEYVKAFLLSGIGQRELDRIKRPVARANINLEEIGDIKVLIPNIEIQNEIVDIMEAAYAFKKQKDGETRQSLDLINDFVLNELNCTIQQSSKLCFRIYLDQIKNRLDPLYYSNDIFSFLSTSPYKQMKVGEATSYLKTGFAAGAKDQDETNGILQIRPTNINEKRLLCFDKNIYVKTESLPNKRSYLIRKKDVLFNNTNSQELVGKTAFFDLDGNFFCSNHITRIKVKESIISPEYLWVILNLYQRIGIFFNICTNWNNQSGVNVELLKSIKILVPPIEIQKRITNEVRFRIEKAEQLQKEAQQILEKAKLEVEENLLMG